jgi:hypothetical protein
MADTTESKHPMLHKGEKPDTSFYLAADADRWDNSIHCPVGHHGSNGCSHCFDHRPAHLEM